MGEMVMIDSMWMLTIAGALLAAVFGVLMSVLTWIGNKLYTKLEQITTTLTQIAGELHERINGLDRRTTTLETKCEIHLREHR